MTIFDDVGVSVKKGRCECGTYFRITHHNERLNHFMECPAVDAAILKAQSTLQLPVDGDIGISAEALSSAIRQMNTTLGTNG